MYCTNKWDSLTETHMNTHISILFPLNGLSCSPPVDAYTIKSPLLSSVVSPFYSFFPFSTFIIASLCLLIFRSEWHGYGTLFLAAIQTTSSYPSLVPADLPLDARITVLMGVSSVAGTVCSFLSLPTCFHEANTQQKDTQ